MERLEPTRGHAFRIWWAVTWRTSLPLLALELVAGVGLGVLKAARGWDENTERVVHAAVGLGIFAVGILLYVEMFYRVLRKRFKDFEIALIPPEA